MHLTTTHSIVTLRKYIVHLHLPALVDERVRFYSHDGCYQILCVVTAAGYLDQSIHCPTNEDETTFTNKAQQSRPREAALISRFLVVVKWLNLTGIYKFAINFILNNVSCTCSNLKHIGGLAR